MKKNEVKINTINLEVNDVSGKLFMTQGYADGNLGKTKFTAEHSLPDMGLIVKINDKKYKISSRDIITAIINLHEDNNK